LIAHFAETFGPSTKKSSLSLTTGVASDRRAGIESHVCWFENIRLKDIPEVGGKTASLGELSALLTEDGGRVPDGFALTARAYREVLAAAGAVDKLRRLLADLDHHDVSLLGERAAAARQLVYEATGNPNLCREIAAAYRALETKCGGGVPVAVRSSATAEDLPTASFAGQHAYCHLVWNGNAPAAARGDPTRGPPGMRVMRKGIPRHYAGRSSALGADDPGSQ
jgi:pyruvate phosphate dikinase-like enzyme